MTARRDALDKVDDWIEGYVAVRSRRPYYIGKCQDCGREKRVTTVTFQNGMMYTVCGVCVRAYRGRIGAAPIVWMPVKDPTVAAVQKAQQAAQRGR